MRLEEIHQRQSEVHDIHLTDFIVIDGPHIIIINVQKWKKTLA